VKTRRINLFLSPGEVGEGTLAGHQVVAIDVLRASTTICQAVASGAREILPMGAPEEARRLAETIGRDTTLLAGEREGRVIGGFDLGNSPLEFTPERVRGKTLVMCTTNGSPLLSRLKGVETDIAAFVNLGAVLQRLTGTGGDVAVICSGLFGRFSLEDAVCGGMIVSKLSFRRKVILSDGAVAGKLLARRYSRDILKMIQGSHHGTYLAGLGFGEDLAFAAQVDSLSVVPVLREGRITAK
jgi:2-phosphosulfolactate phosphatase